MLHITGVVKNIILIVASVFIWGTTISWLQILGYSITLVSFALYKVTLGELWAWAAPVVGPVAAPVIGYWKSAKLGPVRRRFVLLAGFVCIALMLLLGLARHRVRMPAPVQRPEQRGWHLPHFRAG